MSERVATTACVAFGANLGDRAAAFASVIAALRATPGVGVEAVSAAHATSPVTPPGEDPASQPEYLNAAIVLVTTLSARELLDALLSIERRLGRDRAREARWGPRTADLDLLLYADAVIDEPGLVVPHPRMHERRFVLEPLAEIAPHAVHPRLGLSVRRMLEALREPSRGG